MIKKCPKKCPDFFPHDKKNKKNKIYFFAWMFDYNKLFKQLYFIFEDIFKEIL